MSENEIIEGFRFTDSKIVAQAKREAEGIQYIRKNTDMENPEIVWQLYQKLIDEKLFETPVGISFLKELRDYLVSVPGINQQELAPIYTEVLLREKEMREIKREKTADKTRMEKKLAQGKKRLRISMAVNLFLIIVLVGVWVIGLSSDSPNIVNYENKLVDKYAQWQQELDEREQNIKKQEQELGITP